ncbi:hypothetical protein GCM10009558_064640 [Virgisporangium aurantiacum]
MTQQTSRPRRPGDRVPSRAEKRKQWKAEAARAAAARKRRNAVFGVIGSLAVVALLGALVFWVVNRPDDDKGTGSGTQGPNASTGAGTGFPQLPAGADPATLLVFTPPVLLSEAADAYRLCVAAWLAAERFGRRGVHAVTDLAGETVLGGHPDLAGLLRDSLLDRLRPADAFHRELASTGLSYLDHGQRLDQTAAALHVHPNTVRYRLRRLHDLTGAPADADQRLTVLETLRWWWALHTWLTSLPPRGSPTPMRRSPPGSAGPTSSGWSTRDS